MKLVEDWKKCHKWWSIRLATLGSGLCIFEESINNAWDKLPQDIKSYIPSNIQPYLAGLFFLIILGRLVKQK